MKHPLDNLFAHTHRPVPSQTRTFKRLRCALQNKNSVRSKARTTIGRARDHRALRSFPACQWGSDRKIDPCSWANPNTAYTRSSALIRRSKVCTSKSRRTSIRRPSDKTSASPQLGCCSDSGFLRANSTAKNFPSAGALFVVFLFHRRFFRWRSRVLWLKPRLRQNSLRRIPLFTNSATNCRTTARVRRLRVASCCSPFIHQLKHRTLLIKQMHYSDTYCLAKDELEQDLSDIRRFAARLDVSSEERGAAVRAKKSAIRLLKEHNTSGHSGKRCPLATQL